MKCKNIKCNNEHDGSYGSGKYCSRSCANSRIKTDEIKHKTSLGMKQAHKEGRAFVPYNGYAYSNKSKKEIEEIIVERKKTKEEKLLQEDFSTLKFERLRQRVILEQNNKCNRCKLDTWLGEPMTFELEHKDGNNENNERRNLEMLCPNCHSLTKTWRGRNKNKKEKKKDATTEEQMVRAYLETGNIRQCLLKLGLAAKGANYGRVKRALTLWEIDY